MDVEKEGRDFVIGSLVGTPKQDVFVPWQSLTLDCSRGSGLRDCGHECEQVKKLKDDLNKNCC